MERCFVVMNLFVCLLLPLPIHAEGLDIPNASLEITVQQKEKGKFNRGFHIFQLFCWDGQCSLTTLSLNQCHQSGEGNRAFYPKIQRSSTLEGNLVVRDEGNTLLVQDTGSDVGGDYVSTLRFRYALPTEDGVVSQVIGFTGGFVKNSVVLQEVLTIEYVPLPKKNQVVQLDCGALLPGIDRE